MNGKTYKNAVFIEKISQLYKILCSEKTKIFLIINDDTDLTTYCGGWDTKHE